VPASFHEQPTCFGCGVDNPAGLHIAFAAQDDELHATMTVTETMVGAPARLHGGITMAFIDEVLGVLTVHRGATDSMTASLTVDLRSPAHVGAVLRQRAWVERREGRKWFVRAEVHEGARLVAEARGLWLEPRPG
jgi:acyl-coenzyme A thioesterase PaaI-like protein